MGRSQSFASTATDYTPFSDSLSLRLPTFRWLTSPVTTNSQAHYAKGTQSPHEVAPTACKRTVSGTISLRCSRCFSPFPHGTSSLSVSQEYLALPDGPGRFRQDSSCPALLRILLNYQHITCTGLSPPMVDFSKSFHFMLFIISQSYNPNIAETMLVQAVPSSLATTRGITFVFFSSAYLDVSVQRVDLRHNRIPLRVGCPIRKSADQRLFAPPHSLSQLITSFIVSESQGIHRTPLLTFFYLLYLQVNLYFYLFLPNMSKNFKTVPSCRFQV